MRMRPLGLALTLLACLAGGGCHKEQAGMRAMSVVGEGVINDPKNKSLRFDLLKFGLGEFCREMNVRGTPLKLRDGEPVLGRFFADSCSSQVIDDDDRQTFVVQFSGAGYAWTNVTGRIGFESSGLIEYAPDFQLHEGRMWIYFRPRNVDATRFTTLLVESGVAQTGLSVTGTDPNRIGRNILDGQLKRGFTVIRHGSSGETEFGMGLVPVGKRPPKPFEVESEDKIVLDNDRTEVHSGQQDFIGGFRVPDDDMGLYVTMKVEGAPSVDVLVLPKQTGDAIVRDYVRTGGPARLSHPPLLDDTVTAGARFTRFVPLPQGQFVMMLDHTAAVGRSAPPTVTGDDRAARVDYVVQLGEAP